jgi:penicillin-binding protein 1C
MHDVSGITGAAPIWENEMTWLHRDAASSAPSPPAGVQPAHARFIDAVRAAAHRLVPRRHPASRR